MLNSFKLDGEEIQKKTTDISVKGMQITARLREIDSEVKNAALQVRNLDEIDNIAYCSLEEKLREIDNVTEKIKRFARIASEYKSEVDSNFYDGQEKAADDLSNLVLNEIHVLDNCDIKSKIHTYGQYGQSGEQPQSLTLEDILNESSVKNSLKDAYDKKMEELKELKEFTEFDVNSLGEGYSEEDKQKLRNAQKEVEEYLKAVEADKLTSISYEEDLEKFLTSDKMNYATRGEKALSTVLDFIPVVGTVKNITEAITGENLITGEKLTTAERIMCGVFSVLNLGAEGALIKNIGKAAVKNGAKSAFKFAAKETIKETAINGSFYGGSVALSEAGIDEKYQTGFMAAVTIFAHGKRVKAKLSNASARVKGVKKGSFLDTLRAENKTVYKDAMKNLKKLTKEKGVVFSCNGVGEIDKMLKENKNLRSVTKKIEKIDLDAAKKSSLIEIFAKGDLKAQNDMIKFLEKGDKKGILKGIADYNCKNALSDHLKYIKDGGIVKPTGGKFAPSKVCAAVNIHTGEIYFGYSGRNGFNPSRSDVLHQVLQKLVDKTKELAKNTPDNPYAERESFEVWPVDNCAEINAVDQALKNGAKIEDIYIRTVSFKTGIFAEFCDNCKVTFKDFMKAND